MRCIRHTGSRRHSETSCCSLRASGMKKSTDRNTLILHFTSPLWALSDGGSWAAHCARERPLHKLYINPYSYQHHKHLLRMLRHGRRYIILADRKAIIIDACWLLWLCHEEIAIRWYGKRCGREFMLSRSTRASAVYFSPDYYVVRERTNIM